MTDPAPIDPLPKVWDPDRKVGEMLKGLRGLVAGIALARLDFVIHSIAFAPRVDLHGGLHHVA